MAWDDGLYGAPREIAETDRSPLRVVAGPGTGKTFALMRRVARLLEDGVDPRRILLVTFTRVAARDLEKALCLLESPGVQQVRKGTLHSFCFATLQRANVLGLTGCAPGRVSSPTTLVRSRVMKTRDFSSRWVRFRSPC